MSQRFEFFPPLLCIYINIYIVIDILEEQAELNEKIMEVEKSRLEATLNLLSSKMEVAKEFRVTKEIYGEMISNENGNYLRLYLLSLIFILYKNV